jgi:UDP-glucose 4-epimerase
MITGGAGFIGSHIVDSFVKDHRVVVLDNLSTGFKKNLNPKAKFYFLDLEEYSKVEEIFKLENPEIIYHLGAQINIRKSVEDPISDAKINILSTLNLLNLAVKYGVKHFIFSSTGGAIYGDTTNTPTTENEKENPISPYGCAKLCIEKYLKFYNKVHNLKYTILRYSNVYGPRQNPHGEAGVISIFFENLFSKKNPILFGGLQTRDFVFVKDVVRANVFALKEDKSETYNIGTGKQRDIIEVFNKISKYFKNPPSPEYRPKRSGEQMRSCLSYEKAEKNLNWRPEVGFEEGLSLTYAWYLTNGNRF